MNYGANSSKSAYVGFHGRKGSYKPWDASRQALWVAGTEQVLNELEKFFKRDKKGARKAVRRASKIAVGKVLIPEYKRNLQRLAYDTGASHDAVRPRAVPQKGWYRHKIGSRIVILQKKMYPAREARTGEPSPVGENDLYFFYPAVVEYGSSQGRQPLAPMRKALQSKDKKCKRVYIRELQKEMDKVRAAKPIRKSKRPRVSKKGG